MPPPREKRKEMFNVSNIIPQVVLVRKGHGDVFAKLQSLALTYPKLTIGELLERQAR